MDWELVFGTAAGAFFAVIGAALFCFLVWATIAGGKLIKIEREQCKALGGEYQSYETSQCFKPNSVIELPKK